jgi:FkbM family methyltransferase
MKWPVTTSFSLREASSDQSIMREVLMGEVYGNLTSYLGDCRTIIDLGANIGLASLHLSVMFPKARILAVEPEPGNFEMLNRNLGTLISKGRCQTLQAAIWNVDQPVNIKAHEGNFDWGFTAVPSAGKPGDVPGLSMNSILDRSGFDTVDLLKVDVEGAELQMFQGDLSWLPRVRAIAIEFHDNSRRESRFDEIIRGRQITSLNPHTVLAYSGTDSKPK